MTERKTTETSYLKFVSGRKYASRFQLHLMADAIVNTTEPIASMKYVLVKGDVVLDRLLDNSVYAEPETTANSKAKTPIQSREPEFPFKSPIPITPHTDIIQNRTCPNVAFSFRKTAAAIMETIGIIAIMTPENEVVE